VDIARGDGIGIKHGVRLIGRFATPRIANPAVDNEMGDMNALGRKFPRHALRQSPESELAHREGCRLRITLDARGGFCEQDGTAAPRQHALCRLLGNAEAAKTIRDQGTLDLRNIKVDKRTTRSGTRVEDYDVQRGGFLIEPLEEGGNLACVGDVASEGLCPRFGAEVRKFAVLRAARKAEKPSRANRRAKLALSPDPLPTIRTPVLSSVMIGLLSMLRLDTTPGVRCCATCAMMVVFLPLQERSDFYSKACHCPV
jgi:hypothetical protein